MRIAFLTNIPVDFTGSGGSVHVSQLAKRLINRGHTLYTNLENESDHFVKFSAMDFSRRGKDLDVFYIRLDGWPGRDCLTLWRQSNPHAPCIWEINAPLEEMRTSMMTERDLEKFNKRRKKFTKMVNAAICISVEMEEYARNHLGIRDTFVISNGSDPDFFNPENRDERLYDQTKFNILWAGLPRYKWQGLNIVEQLAFRLKEKGIDDVMLIVTAEGKSSENLRYLGHIPYCEMPRYMVSADVGLCVYDLSMYRHINAFKLFYGSPLKLYDYMASGLPVIGSDVGQIKLIIEEHHNGLLTDNSVDDLVEKIIFLRNNPNIASTMGSRGRKAVIEKYNWEDIVLRTEAILLDAVKHHSASKYELLRCMMYRSMNRVKQVGKAVLGRKARDYLSTKYRHFRS